MSDQSCPLPPRGKGEVETVTLRPESRVSDYQEAMVLAKAEAAKRFNEYMLISWYDRDRDFESPPNTTECPEGCEKNGYILYGLNHGAKLKVDVEDGRFVFFFTPVEW
ncbi:MAG: AF1514 family protein [Desulfobulbaceae bacterium]|nr:AF1514 family protein [Desulfobulbaceae bacterium]